MPAFPDLKLTREDIAGIEDRFEALNAVSETGGQRPPLQLNAKEKLIHDQGLVSVLKQLHDELDAAVFAAYGWPATLTDAEILERLVALNAERAREEANGVIRWLRPEYQAKGQGTEDRGQGAAPSKDSRCRRWLAPLGNPRLGI